ncbi:MAG: hypothetical protein CME90_20720 [Hoeflea sp.]|nr:hypothetical protein [Hoeflea sp.]|tara:strand:- start:767 stop:1843 length:1077 start_codon:yes stop_codon:yes gene_type:complete
MSFLKWLFGKSSTRGGDARPGAEGWAISENGNPTMVDGQIRITVFPQDRGWKFCIADVDDRNDPYFSDVYSSEVAAKEEALAHLRGEPTVHEPHSASRTEDGRDQWEAHIRARSVLIEEIQKLLSENPELGITALRKPEAKVSSHLKQLKWQIAEYHRAGVSVSMIAQSERQEALLSGLADKIGERIKAKQAQRPARKPPVSDSQLSSDLAGKVDDVIGLLAKQEVIDAEEQARLHRNSIRATTDRMLEEGITYGLASNGPDFLNHDESSFRAFMKTANQDLGWQCDTISDAFRRYLTSGEIPAPHYPMRVAVLLRKEKDFEREKRFLAACCKHFPSENGTTYAKLVERAKKTGAIPG